MERMVVRMGGWMVVEEWMGDVGGGKEESEA